MVVAALVGSSIIECRSVCRRVRRELFVIALFVQLQATIKPLSCSGTFMAALWRHCECACVCGAVWAARIRIRMINISYLRLSLIHLGLPARHQCHPAWWTASLSVCLSVRPSIRSSVRLSIRYPSHLLAHSVASLTLFSHLCLANSSLVADCEPVRGAI